LKLSQFVPSSQESSAPPVGGNPDAVPAHVTVGPEGPIVALEGSAANARKPAKAESAIKLPATIKRRATIPDRPGMFRFMAILLHLFFVVTGFQD
jgi:hypothetical protein